MSVLPSGIRIGHFARLGGVSIATLRHYEALGLLHPDRVDPATGYRYYVVSQLARLHRLLAFRELGFSLGEIRRLLHREIDAIALCGALTAKRDELRTRVQLEQTQLARVEQLLRVVEVDGRTPLDVVIKDVDARAVASMRSRMADYSGLEPLLHRLATAVQRADGFSELGAVWHRCARLVNGEKRANMIDCEALAFLTGSSAELPGCRVFELPAARVAAVIHSDAEELTPTMYATIDDAVNACGYEIVWPMREVYLRAGGAPGGVVEAHFPLRRMA